MQIISSKLLDNTNEILFGFSTKIGLDRTSPYYFNMSYTVGDEKENVDENRKVFFEYLGLSVDDVAFQKQIHSDTIKFVDKGGSVGESDALITKQKKLGLAISSADCTPIFIYDKENKIIAAVHSGWRGTQKCILKKVLKNLNHHFSSKPEDLLVYVAPSISQMNYEIGKEVAVLFDPIYLKMENGKIFLDVQKANINMLYEFGIPKDNIEISTLCSYEEKNLLHSYRRDGKLSGRSLGIIAMRNIDDIGKI